LVVEVRDYGTGANVVALLPATSAPGTSRVVLGAHFDGVRAGPAAADNATGVALVVAAARWILEAFPCRTRDLEFVLFDEEEDGLRGSGVYATGLTSDPVPTVAAHSFDMISWDMDGDRLLELWLPSAEILAHYEAAAAAHGARVASRRFMGSDHVSFYDRGIPTAGICEEFVGGDTSPHYHTAEDTYDKVDFPFLALATTVAIDAVGREITTP
jgi:Zn-dependent M28 family amino/carboxypeptidase